MIFTFVHLYMKTCTVFNYLVPAWRQVEVALTFWPRQTDTQTEYSFIYIDEWDFGWAEDIDGETNDMHKGHEILSKISLLVLSAFITFRNFLFRLISDALD